MKLYSKFRSSGNPWRHVKLKHISELKWRSLLPCKWKLTWEYEHEEKIMKCIGKCNIHNYDLKRRIWWRCKGGTPCQTSNHIHTVISLKQSKSEKNVEQKWIPSKPNLFFKCGGCNACDNKIMPPPPQSFTNPADNRSLEIVWQKEESMKPYSHVSSCTLVKPSNN